MSRLYPASVVLSLLLVALLLLIHHHGTDARVTQTMPRICYELPPRSEGVCAISVEGYYYDSSHLDCISYNIGACHLTVGQTFGSQQDCIATCIQGNSRNQDLYVNE
ncbi:papilin [Drosophila eugracilis]|uniref:papilin n=1 Tax=Drosophila eugracilis TaxID=29029 RepID=UPI0007E5E998|nr:papilin [Drosophila eugracilis]